MTDRKIVYATHPLRAELKAEANKAGVKIIDAAFAPAGERIMDGQTGLPVGEDVSGITATASQIGRMNKAALIAFLAAKGVETPNDATNAQLAGLALPFAEQD
ncbi:hypothetical protein [Falsigemmobacter faecalis]|uniref:Uncharacterized protein n=1 Tax=Falsigemmobacter faecalis TaxID=2488730 RepID=A0A3P3CZL1_9RHOB|nr:hypothetical protein [Falsigemmobacter faecalis]RRH67627.1 hypothetical protein EG244_19990 [Falsigemmobacter faecalis]